METLEQKRALLQAERLDFAERAECLSKAVAISNYNPVFVLESVLDLQRRTYRLQTLCMEIKTMERCEKGVAK